MKLYILMTVETSEKVVEIYYHKNFYADRDSAFKDCLSRPNTSVLEFEQSCSWNHFQIKQEMLCS
jgi:hypothetical protein